MVKLHFSPYQKDKGDLQWDLFVMNYNLPDRPFTGELIYFSEADIQFILAAVGKEQPFINEKYLSDCFTIYRIAHNEGNLELLISH